VISVALHYWPPREPGLGWIAKAGPDEEDDPKLWAGIRENGNTEQLAAFVIGLSPNTVSLIMNPTL
jgi:hypothetical protein